MDNCDSCGVFGHNSDSFDMLGDNCESSVLVRVHILCLGEECITVWRQPRAHYLQLETVGTSGTHPAVVRGENDARIDSAKL